jgi:two-component system response regulator RegX3
MEPEGPMRVLVVEDDDAIGDGLEDGLTDQGFVVIRARNGAEALQADPGDVVLLDLGLPDMDGRDVCRAIRARTSTPIIMLTARAEEFDRVLGLELGADDYVTKPFSFRELVARIRAVARRSQQRIEPEDESAIVRGSLTIDVRAHRVLLRGSEVKLTPKEFDLLRFLATTADAVRTRSEILDEVWDVNWYGPTKTVDAHVATIRQKLGDSRWIEAVRGVGFRLVEVE